MNNSYSIIAPAKLNLNLFVRGKASNGLHLIESDVCFLELSDNIFLNLVKMMFFFKKIQTSPY